MAIGAIRFLGSIPQVKEAVVLATTVKPETFTELYFEDHTNLPKEFSSNKTYSFSFTIHNLEYKDFTYQYEVRSIDELGFSLLQKDSITLKHDEFRTIPVSFKTLKVESNRFQVEVKILDKNQTIHFWMEEKAS
ncbi:MAG: hypothetical protein WCT77_04615 [Bacteroidota bacterium]